MLRSDRPEIMDSPDIPVHLLTRFHKDLRLVHRLMGTVDIMAQKLQGAGSIVDIGCGDGALAADIGRKIGAAVTGVDLRGRPEAAVPVIAADATRDDLPRADAAFSTFTIHHLTDRQTIELIRNVGRACGRFVILDLVRSSLPLTLFTLFIGPLLSHEAAADGRQSIRRAYTGPELRALVEQATAGTGATFQHWVSRYAARQIVEITYRRP